MEPVFSFLKLLKFFGLNLIKDKVARNRPHCFLPFFDSMFYLLSFVDSSLSHRNLFLRFLSFFDIFFLHFCCFFYFLLYHAFILTIILMICYFSINLLMFSRSIHGAKRRGSTIKWCPCALSLKRSRSTTAACSLCWV